MAAKTITTLISLMSLTLVLNLRADDKPFAGQQLDQQRVLYEKRFKKSKDRLFLFFNPKENGAEFPNQVINFDLTLGNTLVFGPYKIANETVKAYLTEEQVKDDELLLTGDQRKWEKRKVISFSWPLSYVFSGRVEIRNDANEIKFSKEIKQEDVWLWLNHLETRITDNKFKNSRIKSLQENEFIEDNDLAKSAAEGAILKIDSGHWGSSFGLVGENINKDLLKTLSEPFRFCIIKDERDVKQKTGDESLLTVCSQRYRMGKKSGVDVIQSSGKTYEPQIAINNQRTTLKGRAFFANEDVPVQFSALMQDGTYFEFISSPKPVNIIDMVLDPAKNQIEIVGFGNPPIGEVEVIRRDQPDFWSFLNFMPTIGDFRNFWRAKVPKDKPVLYLRGEAGFPFRQEIFFKDLPKTKHRVLVDPSTTTSTYKDEIEITGLRADPKTIVSSRQKRAIATENGGFEWTFLSKKGGDFNRSTLFVKSDDEPKPWRSYYEIYKGYPGELSLRGTGILGTDSSLLFLAEVAGQYWIEDIFGWQNSLLSKQRWGMSARHFRNMLTVNSTEETADFKFEATNVDLKYRLTPGVWGRDPTLGLIGGYQAVNFVGYEVQMAGGGMFWARSMPKIFDGLFNLLPFMRYPKWVDMELLWYPVSLNSLQSITFTFALNFHGKVQWSKRWFGEAGFGIRNFSWQHLVPEEEREIAFGAAYGTVGLGYQF